MGSSGNTVLALESKKIYFCDSVSILLGNFVTIICFNLVQFEINLTEQMSDDTPADFERARSVMITTNKKKN